MPANATPFHDGERGFTAASGHRSTMTDALVLRDRQSGVDPVLLAPLVLSNVRVSHRRQIPGGLP